ncbi:hypothetical protein [Pontibacter indicus]|uniref:DUF4145 domain-containing protein n=1 Tax=Pontibacter indicus TaxID=1317125 RepID=A0A1R3XAK0_9BACT|nr:hypothetical protein [Pontibacter indicus]SIT88117.1 hypothetical protein SAMN05444128_1779 [Pontibacter indicus]
MTVHELIEQTADFEKLQQVEQIKLIAFFHCKEHSKEFFETKHIKEEFEKHSLVTPAGITSLIPRMRKSKPPVFILTKNGNSIHRTIKKELEEQYFGSSHKKEVSQTLRDLLNDIQGGEQKRFLEEAISCFEIKSYRAAITMTWLLTIDCLYDYVLNPTRINTFNQAIQSHGKYKKIVVSKKDDFSDIKESDFIELLRVAKLISNDTRKILDEKLGVRNSCAHPNSLDVLDYKAIGFIQDLVINVINKYQ